MGGTSARSASSWGVVADRHGTIFVSDLWNHCIRKVTPGSWAVSTLCGSKQRQSGYADGAGETACFKCPVGLA